MKNYSKGGHYKDFILIYMYFVVVIFNITTIKLTIIVQLLQRHKTILET